MKRRTNTIKKSPARRLRPIPQEESNAKFSAQLYAYVEAKCPEHFTMRDERQAIKSEGVLAFMEAVARGEERGDPETARAAIPLIQAAIQDRRAQS